MGESPRHMFTEAEAQRACRNAIAGCSRVPW